MHICITETLAFVRVATVSWEYEKRIVEIYIDGEKWKLFSWITKFQIEIIYRPGQIAQAHTFCLRKRKKIDPQVFRWISKALKKLQWMPNFQILSRTPTYLNVLIMITYLMVSKLLYLLMDWKTTNCLC